MKVEMKVVTQTPVESEGWR